MEGERERGREEERGRDGGGEGERASERERRIEKEGEQPDLFEVAVEGLLDHLLPLAQRLREVLLRGEGRGVG